ncbi:MULTISPECIES: response regulator [Glaesserella]|uniref:Response regulator n=1 Tax=Glaesserella australis TaxID=2094024 RepID=A0A328C4E5_9PAST|nr:MULTISPECIES: response regulator [Glaesserella]AUI66848.1 hypothetical protein CJD39_09785 [Glaesserella sp. 15-184]RAL19900.1 hypothetical protein C5N92_00560 [Glaesserella australis]
MIKILLVEDQEEKRNEIERFILSLDIKVEINKKTSLRGALKEISNNKNYYSLIILDMSLPSYDPSEDDINGGEPESFAGSEILSQMHLRNINIPTIVITQFSKFIGVNVEFKDLDELFNSKYNDFYKGSIFYNSIDNTWKKELEKIISNIYLKELK